MGNEEEDDVVVGRIDDNSKDEDLDEEISLSEGILSVKGYLVDFGCESESRGSTSSVMDFVRMIDDNTPNESEIERDRLVDTEPGYRIQVREKLSSEGVSRWMAKRW